jgi:hypothetical protein
VCLLQGVLPLRHETDGNVGVAGQLANASTDKQGSIVAGIAIVQSACGQVKHTNKERHEHVGLVHVGYGPVHDGDDAVGHRLMD